MWVTVLVLPHHKMWRYTCHTHLSLFPSFYSFSCRISLCLSLFSFPLLISFWLSPSCAQFLSLLFSPHSHAHSHIPVSHEVNVSRSPPPRPPSPLPLSALFDVWLQSDRMLNSPKWAGLVVSSRSWTALTSRVPRRCCCFNSSSFKCLYCFFCGVSSLSECCGFVSLPLWSVNTSLLTWRNSSAEKMYMLSFTQPSYKRKLNHKAFKKNVHITRYFLYLPNSTALVVLILIVLELMDLFALASY